MEQQETTTSVGQNVPLQPVSVSGTTGLGLYRLQRANVLNYIILAIGAVLMVIPFIWMISTSFKPQAETISFPPRILPLIRPSTTTYKSSSAVIWAGSIGIPPL